MALPKFYKVCQDQQGNIVPQVLGSVFNHGTAVLASLYQDDAGTVPLSNPMTSDAQYGSFKFYVNPGHYDLTFTKPGYTFEPIDDMQVPQDVLTLGTMATQNANAVAITGGSAALDAVVTGRGGFYRPNGAGSDQYALFSDLNAAGDATRYALRLVGDAPNYLLGNLGLKTTPSTTGAMRLFYQSIHGIEFLPASDAGTFWACAFLNTSGTPVGSISTSGAATAYNTTSDGRLKEAITPLTGAEAVLRSLRPVAFRWKADGSPGVGFVAEEVAQVVGGVTTGHPGAVDADGQIVPMGMDHAKLVPWLCAALKELLTRVAALEAPRRLAAPAP